MTTTATTFHLNRTGRSAAGAIAALLAALPLLAAAAAPTALEKAPEPAPVSPASVATTNRFDGDWTIRIDCPPDGQPSGAQGYAFDFPASVLNGRLFGSHGPQGAEGSVQVEGTIAPSGDATLQAHGRTSTPAVTTGKPPAGSAYSYDIQAHFEDARGQGRRLETRACEVAFTRR